MALQRLNVAARYWIGYAAYSALIAVAAALGVK